MQFYTICKQMPNTVGTTENFLTCKKHDILNTRNTHVCPILMAICVLDSARTTQRMTFLEGLYPTV